jgi:hypothetical protein
MRSGFDVIRGTPSRRLRYCSSPSRRSLMKSSAKNLSAAALCAECGAVVAFRCGGVSHPAWYANSADAQTNETRFQAALHHARRTQRMRCAPPARSGTRSGALAALLLAAGAAGTPLRVHALERRVGRSRATPKPPNEMGRAHARIPAGREEGSAGYASRRSEGADDALEAAVGQRRQAREQVRALVPGWMAANPTPELT